MNCAPLAVLRARVDTMQNRPSHGEGQGERVVMSHVVDQLLEMAELEGAGIIVTGKTDLSAICEHLRHAGGAPPFNGAKRWPCSVPKDRYGCAAILPLIFRAIRNLAENAIRHTPAGTTVETGRKTQWKRVRQRLARGSPIRTAISFSAAFGVATAISGEGTGLGLAIVSRIAEILSRGKIAVSNRSEGGAIFTLSFPLNY